MFLIPILWATKCPFLNNHIWILLQNSSGLDLSVSLTVPVYPECLKTESGRNYAGTMNVTEDNEPCLRWDSELVASSYLQVAEGFYENWPLEYHFLNQELSSHENFCRNPTWEERPWCFIDVDGLDWNYCRIPHCEDESEEFHAYHIISGLR